MSATRELEGVEPSRVVVEVMLREPWYRDSTSGSTFPMTDAMRWSSVPFQLEADCAHHETVCWSCVDTWAIDHHVRVWQRELLWRSVDAPVD